MWWDGVRMYRTCINVCYNKAWQNTGQLYVCVRGEQRPAVFKRGYVFLLGMLSAIADLPVPMPHAHCFHACREMK